MSWRACKRVWDDFRPGGALKLVLLALADYGDDSGEKVYPSLAGLASKVGLSRAQAKRYVHELVKLHALTPVANQAGGKPGTTTVYRINLDALTGCKDDPRRGGKRAPRDGGHECTGTGVIDARDGGHTCTQTGCNDDPQPLNEPTKNRKQQQPTPATPDADASRIASGDAVFGDGLRFLIEKGTSEASARSFLGKMRRDHGDARVMEAIETAKQQDASAPKAFIIATLQARGGTRKPKNSEPDFSKIDYMAGINPDGSF